MLNEKNLKLTFCSGAGTVTGANFLLEGNGKRFLVDCGLLQGTKLADDVNWEPFTYDPKEIDILFVTHAHIDHIGRIPKLVHDGFSGRIISTIPTKDIAGEMLIDTIQILSHDKENHLDEMYNLDILKKISEMWEGIEYHQTLNVDHGFQFSFKDSGHILGSGMLKVMYEGTEIIFTGDLGNSPSPIIRDTEELNQANYLIMESVYGDRNHEDRELRKENFKKVILDNYNRKGALIIPTFSLERAQELLFEINLLVEKKEIPVMPIFLDSPLAIKLTKVYKKHKSYFNDVTKRIIADGDDIFNFPGFHQTEQTQDSKDILRVPNPKIIMAGSGMSNGGRIIHHEKNYLPDANNTILLVGYQSAGTLGRLIQDGVKMLRIQGEEIPLRARIEKINGYSGHKDSDHLLEFVSKTAHTLKKVFVVMGEPKSALFLAQKLHDNLGVEVMVPDKNDSVILSCGTK